MPAKSVLILLGAILLIVALALFAQPQSKWEGVDAAVVGRYANALGHQASQPLLNVQGDMLLFMFTVGGAAAGFILGYNWRGLFSEDQSPRLRREEVEGRDV